MNINEVEHVISCFFIATLNEKDKNFVSLIIYYMEMDFENFG